MNVYGYTVNIYLKSITSSIFANINKGNIDSAIKYHYQLELLPEKLESTNYLLDYYIQQNLDDSIIKFQNYKLQYKDSLYNENKLKIMNNSVQLFDLLANKENQVLRTQNTEKRNWLIFAILGIAALILILYLSFKNYKNKQMLTLKTLESKNNEIQELLNTQEINVLNAMLKGQTEERNRIAKDLHDSLGSSLSTLKLIIGNISTHANKQNELKNANQLIDNACKDVRKIAHNLYKTNPPEINFITEIENQLSIVKSTKKIETNFYVNKVNLEAYPDIQKDLFLISLELINNTLKYANASQINIQLNKIENELVYTYDDNGKGFNPQLLNTFEGIGFKSIQERVQALNGQWNLDTTPQHGMTIIINIPFV